MYRIKMPGNREHFVPPGHALGRAVRALDWFGRFEVEHGDDDTVELLDRPGEDGRRERRVGADARWTTLSRLPVTFWFAAPWLLVVRGRSGGRRRRCRGTRRADPR